MAKLIMGDVRIRTTDQLKDNWDLGKVLSYYKDGTLLDWMYEQGVEPELTELVEALETVTDPKELAKRLCVIFGVDFDEASFIDSEEAEKAKAKEERLRKFTADDEVLKNVDKVAFDQKELAELWAKGVNTIYLVNNRFVISLDEENITYIGIGDVIAVIRRKEVIDFKALGIEFKNIAFDDNYAAIEKAAIPEVLQEEQTVSDTVSRMIQITEQCWNEVKYELADAKVYFDHSDEAGNKMIEAAIKGFMYNNPGITLDRNDFVALFYPSLHQNNIGLQSLLLCKDGFYFVNELKEERMACCKTILNTSDKISIKEGFVRWDTIIYAFFQKADSFFGKHDKIMLKLLDGKVIEFAQRLNNAFLIDFLVTLINQLKDIDDLAILSEGSETIKRMVAVVEECKKNSNNYLEGDVYIRGNLPKNILDNVVRFFSSHVTTVPVKRNEIIAVYLCRFQHRHFSGGRGCSLNSILITEKGFYYNCNPLKDKERNNIEAYYIPWNKLNSVTFERNYQKNRCYLSFNFKERDENGRWGLYIGTADDLNLQEFHEDTCEKFIVPLLSNLLKEN